MIALPPACTDWAGRRREARRQRGGPADPGSDVKGLGRRDDVAKPRRHGRFFVLWEGFEPSLAHDETEGLGHIRRPWRGDTLSPAPVCS